jgi:hypothetical protein
MGANAQTTVPSFTAGTVLTAAQQNASARTGVPVFASTVTRDAGFGGSGEKTLAEGQLCYVEGTGLQTYNGTAWVTWGTAPSSGLTLISSTTIGSAVSSVTVSSAFSSTYDNYRIIVSGGAASTDIALNLTLGATATGYYRAGTYVVFNSAVVNGVAQQNQTSFSEAFSGTTNTLGGITDVLGPNLAKNTIFLSNTVGAGAARYQAVLAGYLADTTQYTAFTLTASGGTMTGGTVKVYGYQNS